MKMFDRIYDKLKNMKYGYYIAYTVLFAITALISFRFFIFYGKSLIINGDALSQNYVSISYYGALLRDIFKGVLNGNFSIPMWDVNLGLGEDILTTLHYYGIGEPLMLLSALFPQSKGELAFTFIFICRLYLSGLFFYFFSFYKNNSRTGTLIGSFIYIFSGYVMLQVSKHLMIGVPVVFLPLILIGVEKIFKEKKPLIFVLSVAFAAMSNIYYLYSLIIFTVIYFVFRYFSDSREKSIGDFILLAIKFMLLGALALMISAVVILPVFRVMTSDARVGKGYIYDLLYPVRYYLNFIASYTNMQRQDRVIEMGFSVLSVIGAVLLCIKRKNNRFLFRAFILINIFALIPFCAYVFHGFSGIANRWVWAYAMLSGFIFASIYPELLQLGKKEKLIITAAGGVFLACPLLFSIYDT
nr:YfhO family protein [Lachnospiraceae bacterium]